MLDFIKDKDANQNDLISANDIPLTGEIHTVDTLADAEPGLNHGGIRWTIHKHRDALLEEGAIFYCGKKLLIDRPRFISFIKRNSVR